MNAPGERQKLLSTSISSIYRFVQKPLIVIPLRIPHSKVWKLCLQYDEFAVITSSEMKLLKLFSSDVDMLSQMEIHKHMQI